jgi:mono/diheme cytochrome c family protein
MKMKNIFKYILPAAVIVAVAGCTSDPKSPGYEYMPDMYNAVGYEANSANPNFRDSMTQQQPVAGTIARGDDIYTALDRMPYPYENTPEGYEASAALRNPLERTLAAVAEGQRLYGNFCLPCHGATGMGDGPVVQHNGPKPMAYSSDALKDLPEGKAFHTAHFGKNMMGSYASQVTASERWKIIMYVQTLQKPGVASAAADSAGTEKEKM